MKKTVQFLIGIAVLLSAGAACAQSEVSVDPLTGTGNVTIPIYTVRSGAVAVPVSLVYSGSGIKPRDVEGPCGMGWNLNAGGAVTRVVRGLPDDVSTDGAGNTLYGWMNATNPAASAIGNGSWIQNNGSTCSNETNDISYINSNFSSAYDDTEPDLFYVNAPGLSCQLIYDRVSQKFQPVGYQDITVTYGHGITGSTTLITYFTITNNKGVVYQFGTNNISTNNPLQRAYKYNENGSQVYFAKQFQQYSNSVIYYDTWYLASISDANGNSVNFTYTAYPLRGALDPILLYANASGTATLNYNVSSSVLPECLTGISTSNAYNSDAPVNRLTFTWTTFSATGETGQTVMNSITGMGRDFFFNYTPVSFTPTGSTTPYLRNFLRGFVDQGLATCYSNTPINYQFTYIGETFSGGVYTTTMPDSSSVLEDYWGYYAANGNTSLMPKVMIDPSSVSTNSPRYGIYSTAAYTGNYAYTVGGSSRAADPVNVMTGSLNKIMYATGGTTTITYESNDYVDGPSGAVIQGSGIRVKTIVDSAGIGATNNITRNYTYIDPTTGYSSGKPTTQPSYAFTIPYSGSGTGQTLWNASTMLSAYDLSDGDHTILYGYSAVSQTGAGKTQYQFYIPAMAWDASAIPDCTGCTTTPSPEWTPTINYMARNNCSSSYGPISNGLYNYPFIPNTNYDFERGLIKSVISYNDSNAPVSESDYTYTRSYNPTAIYAFKDEDDPNSSLLVKTYSVYTDFYNTSELTATVTKKLYNSPTPATAQTSEVYYIYGSSYHKLLTQQYSYNSDNTLVKTYYSYVKDLDVTAASTNPNINALYELQLKNENLPVETYQTVTRPGSSAVYTSASLTLFNTFNAGLVSGLYPTYLPSQQFKMYSGDGNTSFSPFTVTGSTTFTKDSNYLPVANFDYYDLSGYPLTADDANKDTVTTLTDYNTNKVVATFKNAAYNEVAYDDFDSQLMQPINTFTVSGSGSYTPVGSHAGNAGGMAVGQTITCATLNTNPNTQNYIFSAWVNPNALSATITININGTATSYTKTITGSWQYCEFKIPASAFPAYPATYTIGFTVSANPVSVDDILIYPEVAEAQTATYDPTTFFKLDQTNTNGISTYYTFDQWGRNLFTYDQFKNILQKNVYMSYLLANEYANYSFGITNGNGGGYSQPYTTVPIPFYYTSNLDPCATEGMTVTWNFGDGDIETDPYSTPPTHTYASANTYTVTASLKSPYFAAPKSASTSITVSTKPPAPPVNVNLSYVSNTFSNGDINEVTFSGSTNYNFTGSQLNTASVAPGTYTISVTISDGLPYNPVTGVGYACLFLNGDCTNVCSNYNAYNHNIYTFTGVVLTTCTTLQFVVSQFDCSHFTH